MSFGLPEAGWAAICIEKVNEKNSLRQKAKKPEILNWHYGFLA